MLNTIHYNDMINYHTQFSGPNRNPKFSTSDRKSIKSTNAGGSGGRRSSSGIGPVNSQSLGSNYTSATSGSSSGGKRSLHSGGSIDSSGVRDQRDGLCLCHETSVMSIT